MASRFSDSLDKSKFHAACFYRHHKDCKNIGGTCGCHCHKSCAQKFADKVNAEILKKIEEMADANK